MNISKLLETARRSMSMHQNAIGLTGKNISNVNTPGYSRLRAQIDFNGFSQIGGLSEENVQRIRQRFIDRQFWTENQELGRQQTKNLMLTEMESILAEPTGSGLNNVMTEFWLAWDNLANDPTNEANRSAAINQGELLANTFNRISTQNRNMQDQVNTEIGQTVSTINSLASRISDLNGKIIAGESDLVDQRDLLVDQISEFINIQAIESDDSSITLSVGGMVLVSGNSSNELSTSLEMENDLPVISINWGNENTKANITSGSLRGMLDIHNDHIPEMIGRMNVLANSMVENVNEIFQNANQSNFFSTENSGASGIQVSQTVNLTGFDGTAAGEISSLQYDTNSVGNLSYFDYYNDTLSSLGTKIQDSQFSMDNQLLITDKLSLQRMSISGVSIDEEMTHLIEYEQAYNAAARLVNTVQELNRSVLNMI